MAHIVPSLALRCYAAIVLAQISVRVQPGASKDDVRFEGDGLRVRVAAPAVEGSANRRLIEVLAKRLKVPRSSMRIARGASSRQKVLEIDGLELDEVRARLTLQT